LQQNVGGGVAFRENLSPVRTIVTDREFEILLQRTSAFFKALDFRVLKFPEKTGQRRLGVLRTR
jgi:hypothetical protein